MRRKNKIIYIYTQTLSPSTHGRSALVKCMVKKLKDVCFSLYLIEMRVVVTINDISFPFPTYYDI